MDLTLFSIVIPCKNEKHFIGKALDSIHHQTVMNRSVPVFIADNNSTDGTLDIVQSFIPDLNIQIIEGGLPQRPEQWCKALYE